jgi:nucleoside-diphosphate-sugar epimerase
MHNSALINLNVLDNFKSKSSTIFYASSACIYPEENQLDPQNPNCAENTAYPANPDSEYGWEKLFSERLFLSFARNYGTDIRIARLHNVYGAFGSFANGREKAPSALCRKVIDAEGNSIDVWGSGNQTRSFLYIDDCIDAIILLMQSKLKQAINIGSEDLISIADLARMIVGISQKNLDLHFVDGPTGVPGRCSDNRMIRAELYWEPKIPLSTGIKNLYNWIEEEMSK